MSRCSSVRSASATQGRRARGFSAGCVAFLIAGCSAESSIEGSSGPQAFIERLGTDTLSFEVYTRTADGFEGDVLIRSPVTRIAHYEATLTSEGDVARMNVEWRTPKENPDGPPARGFTITFEGDSATVERRGGRNPGTTRMTAPIGTIPTVGKSPIAFAVFEQAVRQAVASGSENYAITLLQSRRMRLSPNAIVRFAPDSVSMDYFGNPIVARVDEDGRVLGRSGERTTVKIVGERISGVDLERLAAVFAARDARGEGLGVASPRATVEASLGGAAINIVYSSPAKRSREIWGGLVPWNEVWRTGANAATAFSTDRDLEIGAAHVPAGDYTLYSIYTAESAKLIINRQTGQWGTVYDEDQDLARVDLARESLPETVERFTIAVESTDDGGLLRLSWDRTRFSVPLKVR